MTVAKQVWRQVLCDRAACLTSRLIMCRIGRWWGGRSVVAQLVDAAVA
jgi:hypothetical protein